MNRIDALKSRWRPEWSSRPDLSKLNASFQKALHYIESLPAHRAEISKTGTLSPKGIAENVRVIAGKDIVPDLRRASWEAEKVANGIKNQMLQLAVPKPDKSDVAGAMLRGEIRAMLRDMDQGERLGLIMSDSEFLVAAFEGPAALSGLTQELRTDLEQRMIREHHGPALEAMDTTKQAIDVAQAAIEMALGTVRAEAFPGESDTQFNRWMAAASADVEREIAVEKATAQPTRTSAEILTGNFPSAEENLNNILANMKTYRLTDDGQIVENGTLGKAA